MKSTHLLQAGIIAVALAVECLAVGAGAARASQITLDVNATMAPNGAPASCGPTCTLGARS